jgi:hypothetical protein
VSKKTAFPCPRVIAGDQQTKIRLTGLYYCLTWDYMTQHMTVDLILGGNLVTKPESKFIVMPMAMKYIDLNLDLAELSARL